jgi:hypothetical protein
MQVSLLGSDQFLHWAFVGIRCGMRRLHLTLRLTYCRRERRWSAEKIDEQRRTSERKAWAAVRCRRFVMQADRDAQDAKSHRSDLRSSTRCNQPVSSL